MSKGFLFLKVTPGRDREVAGYLEKCRMERGRARVADMCMVMGVYDIVVKLEGPDRNSLDRYARELVGGSGGGIYRSVLDEVLALDNHW